MSVGSDSDDAGTNLSNWFQNFYGARGNISYCFPPLAYQLFGIPYLLRMPVLRPEKLLLTQAFIDLTEEISVRVSQKQLALLEQEFNEFYDAMDMIARLDPTTVVHLESSAQRIHTGAVHYALSRWESLHFIERAMKEVLEPLGIRAGGAEGHDIAGFLHEKWIQAGKTPLPNTLLANVQCTAHIRYEKAPQPFLSTLKAHHSAIRLGALIANELSTVDPIEEKVNIRLKDLARGGIMALARILPALAQLAPEESRVSIAKPVRLIQEKAPTDSTQRN